MGLRRYLIVMSVLTLAAFMAVIALLTARDAGIQEGPNTSQDGGALTVLGSVEDVELVSSSGDPFNVTQLRGNVWVADFIFTSCAGVCPIMSSAMAELQRTFVDDERVHFVSITVDPSNDTPEVLAEYADRYEANPDRWHFLTGESDTLHALSAQVFKVGSLDDPLNHSVRFILVDADGSIRGYYIGTESEDLSRLTKDISRLLNGDAM